MGHFPSFTESVGAGGTSNNLVSVVPDDGITDLWEVFVYGQPSHSEEIYGSLLLPDVIM